MDICLSLIKTSDIMYFFFTFIFMYDHFPDLFFHSCAPNFIQDAIAMLDRTVRIPVLLQFLNQR